MMSDKFSTLKKKLMAGETLLGSWSILTSASMTEIGALAGLDFQILDMEHGTFDPDTLENAIRACEAANGSPLVRIPNLCVTACQTALDLGAHGIIVPQIKSAEDARTAVQFCKYAPRGVRGYNPFIRAARYSAPENNQNGKLHNDFGLTGIILENREAYADLPNIIKIDGLDIIYLGIYDMSVALGYQGNTKTPEMLEFVRNATQQIMAAGKIAGMMVRNDKEMQAALELGATFLVCGIDAHIYYQAVHQSVEMFQMLKARGKNK